jgi:VIT1/CCC1 family predicted Fe2+/Mn2+ transporter
MSDSPRHQAALGRRLVLDELFDLSLYRSLREFAGAGLRPVLDQLIAIEERHYALWQKFFELSVASLDPPRRLKLGLIRLICRLFGERAIHMVLEAIEVYGIRKYLALWELYKNEPLGATVREILEDEFGHEDAIVAQAGGRQISADRVRNIFLGLNDGLVEILGAVSGFFAAFGQSTMVLIAGATTAVAGSLSMGAGAYVAASSEQEVTRTQEEKSRFLGRPTDGAGRPEPAFRSAVIIGASYMLGALVPILPVLLGATTALASVLAGAVTILFVSTVLAFLSGMAIRKRAATNLVILAAAVGVTYAIGLLVRSLWGIEV